MNANARDQSVSVAISHAANTFTLIRVHERAFERLDRLKLVREYGQNGLLSQDSHRDRLLAVHSFLRCTIY